MNTRMLLLAAATGAVALATGCSSTTTTVTVPANHSTGTGAATGSATTPPATSSPAATSNAAGVPQCPTRYLKATLGPAQGAAGSTYIALQLSNIGPATCTLYGYPGVALAGGSPATQIGQGADRSTTSPKVLVTLAPGAISNAMLRIAQAGNYPSSTCNPKPSTYLQIFPPNQTTPIYLAYTSTACANSVHQMSITPMKAGSGG